MLGYTDFKAPVYATVAFGQSDMNILKALKKGYRHCAVFLHLDDSLLLVDPRAVGCDIRVLPRGSVSVGDLAGLNDTTLIRSRIYKHSKPYRVPTFFTCVEVVKRALGIRAWWIVTPYQLYKHLVKLNQQET